MSERAIQHLDYTYHEKPSAQIDMFPTALPAKLEFKLHT